MPCGSYAKYTFLIGEIVDRYVIIFGRIRTLLSFKSVKLYPYLYKIAVKISVFFINRLGLIFA